MIRPEKCLLFLLDTTDKMDSWSVELEILRYFDIKKFFFLTSSRHGAGGEVCLFLSVRNLQN